MKTLFQTNKPYQLFFFTTLAFSLFLFLAGALKYTPTTFDDAYNYLRYAKNMLAGHGQSYNASDGPIYGLTSQFYFFYVTALCWILPFGEAFTIEIASSLMALLSFFLILFGLTRIAKSNAFRRNYLYFCLAILCLLLMNRMMIFHAFSGMDTTTSLLWNTMLIFGTLAYVRSPNYKNIWWIVLPAFLAIFTRPDNVFNAFLFPGLLMLTQIKGQRKFISILIFGGIMAALIAFDLWMKDLYFGDFVPTTYYVKKGGFFEGYTVSELWNPMEYLLQFLTAVAPFIMLLLFTLSAKTWKYALAFMIPPIISFSYYFTVFQIMGMEARYYFPSMPYFVIGSFLIFDHFLAQGNWKTFKTHLLSPFRIIPAYIFFVLIVNAKVVYSKYENLYLKEHTTFYPAYKPVTESGEIIEKSEWLYHINHIRELANALPKSTKIATTEMGRISANGTHLEILDMIGFHNRSVAYHGFSADSLMIRQPDLVFIHHVYSGINKEILDINEFHQKYDFYPNAFYGGLAIRRDSPRFQKIQAAVTKVWNQAYPKQPMEAYRAKEWVQQ